MKTLHYSKRRPQSAALTVLALVFTITFFASQNVYSQVGINNTNPRASLDITAENPSAPTETEGLLVPRVSVFPSTNPGADQNGMLIYLTTTVGLNSPGFYYWDNAGSNWVSIQDGNSSGVQEINDLTDGLTNSSGRSIFLGVGSGLNDDATNNQNVGLGYRALESNTSGNANIGIGYFTLFNQTTGNNNVGIGHTSLLSATTANFNTAIGYQSMRSTTMGNSNVAIGRDAMNANTTGSFNVAVGANALESTTVATNNTAVGYEALTASAGSGNTAVGFQSLLANTNGTQNSALGQSALNSNVNGSYNAALGVSALGANTIGQNNVGLGPFALSSNTTGNYNIAIGLDAGDNITGSNNVFIGRTAGGNNSAATKSGGVYIGNEAGYGETASNRLYIDNSNANANNALLYGEFDNNILRTNSRFQIGNPASGGFQFPLIDGTGGQLLITNGAGSLSWQDPSAIFSDDADFFEQGTTTAPDDIQDAIFHMGQLAVGISTTAQTKFRVVTPSSDAYVYGIANNFLPTVGSSSNDVRAFNNLITADQSAVASTSTSYGIYNSNDSNSSVKYGIYNRVTDAGSGNGVKIGVRNRVDQANTDTGNAYGIRNTVVVGSGTATRAGLYQEVVDNAGSSTGPIYGNYSDVENAGSGITYGYHSLIETDNNNLAVAFNAVHAGTSGTGTKFGFRSIMPSTVGGSTQYGFYSEALGSSAFAGMFLGDLAVGTSLGNYYIMPASRGTNGQVMQTDGAGVVSWQDLPAYNQYWSRSGTDLDVANAADDINFASDQTSITFPATTGTPSSMMYLFSSGTNNSDRMIFSQSAAFPTWGLMYRDSDDSFRFQRGGTDRVVVNLGGAGNPLVVTGNAQATAFVSATTTYPDYVFEDYYLGKSSINESYDFPSLEEVEAFIKRNGHLPGVKSYKEVEEQNMTIDVGATSVANLEKIEELFLYTIELKKENQALKKSQADLEKRLETLEAALLKKD